MKTKIDKYSKISTPMKINREISKKEDNKRDLVMKTKAR